MEMIKKIVLFLTLIFAFVACKNETKESEQAATDIAEEEVDTIEVVEIPVVTTTKQIKEELVAKGFKTFDYVDEKTKDTVLMQQYFMAFLKAGPIRSQNEEDVEILQKQHLAHLSKMYELGYADISGPFGDNGEIRGITIYNVPTLKMADSLANADPMVKAGHLVIEMHPWWAAKGFPLR